MRLCCFLNLLCETASNVTETFLPYMFIKLFFYIHHLFYVVLQFLMGCAPFWHSVLNIALQKQRENMEETAIWSQELIHGESAALGRISIFFLLIEKAGTNPEAKLFDNCHIRNIVYRLYSERDVVILLYWRELDRLE